MQLLSTRSVEASSLRTQRMLSLAQQFDKLRCKTRLLGPLDTISVIPTRYPFYWCINKLGWTVEKTLSGQHRIHSRNGHFQLEHIWQGVDYLRPVGTDWWEA